MTYDLAKFCENYGWKFSNSTTPIDAFSPSPRIIFLIPSWSKVDLDALSMLAPKIATKNISVTVFDIDKFLTQEKLEAMFPGIPPVLQTPAFLHFKNGELVAFRQGQEVKGWHP